MAVQRWEDTEVTNVQDFERAWPRIERSLMRSLRGKVDLATAEDICQGVAEQALQKLSRFRSVRDLVRWGQRAARNDATDARRDQRRQVVAAAPPDVESPVDLTNLVRYRAAIDETARALFALTPEERAALLATDLPQVVARPGKEGVADKKRRERARARLRGMVTNYPAVLWIRTQHWLRKRGVRLGGFGETLVGAGVVAALLATAPVRHAAPHEDAPRRLARPEIAAAAMTPGRGLAEDFATRRRASSPQSSRGERHEPSTAASSTWRPLVEVVAPTGGLVDAGFVEHSEPQPLFCAATDPTGTVCLDAPPAAEPQLPPAP